MPQTSLKHYTTLLMSFQYACFGLIFQIDVSLLSFVGRHLKLLQLEVYPPCVNTEYFESHLLDYFHAMHCVFKTILRKFMGC